MEVNIISPKRMKKNVLFLALTMALVLVVCGAVAATDEVQTDSSSAGDTGQSDSSTGDTGQSDDSSSTSDTGQDDSSGDDTGQDESSTSAGDVGENDLLTSSDDGGSGVDLGDVQVPFVENEGQLPDEVDYYADTYYGTAYVTSDGITHDVNVSNTEGVALQEQFLDENGNPINVDPVGEDESETQVNYFVGSDSSEWYSNLSTYNLVSLGEIYPNISVKLRAHGGTVEKLFCLESGSSVDDIVVQIQGANSLEILDDGSLAIITDAGTVTMSAPQATQNGQNVNVTYKLLGNNSYGFTLGDYDTNETLVIDPILNYSTYVGGSGNEEAQCMTVDKAGNVYLSGLTDSTDFPVTPGAYQSTWNGGSGSEPIDVYVVKLNSAGTGLVYCTYIGGTDNEVAYGIIVDKQGNAYIAGSTTSTDFPVTANAYQKTYAGTDPGSEWGDVFVVKLNPNGTVLLYSTYLGGTGVDCPTGIAVDNEGNAYVTGWAGVNYPVTPGALQTTHAGGKRDIFLTKLNPDGSGLVYSTYLGGSSEDRGRDVAVDEEGYAYVLGNVISTDFPVTANAYQTTYQGSSPWNYGDCTVSKINKDGSGLVYSTYIGGTADEICRFMALDSAGNVYLTGFTYSTDYPVTPNAYQTTYAGGWDVFVTKLNSSGTDLVYSTYFGGSGMEWAEGIVVDKYGNASFAGWTLSTDFPVTPNASQKTNAGGRDAFLARMNSSGTGLLYSTYFGGTGEDIGMGIGMDGSGNVYLAGYTESTDFPVTPGTYQTTYAGGWNDLFVVKFAEPAAPRPTVDRTVKNGVNYSVPVYVDITPSNSTLTIGDTETYTFKLDKNSLGNAANMVFTIVIPEGMEFVNASVSQGTCEYDSATRTLTWKVDSITDDLYLWLELRALQTGTFYIQPNISIPGYNPKLNIGSLIITVGDTTVTT